MPQCSPPSGQVLLLCHRVSSPEECGLATFWLLIVCVKSMSKSGYNERAGTTKYSTNRIRGLQATISGNNQKRRFGAPYHLLVKRRNVRLGEDF